MLSIHYVEILKFLFISLLIIYILLILIFILSGRTKDKKILIKKNNRSLFVVNNKKKYNFNKNIKRFYANNILKVNNTRTNNNKTIFGTYNYNSKKQPRLDFISKYSSDSRPKNYEQKIENLLKFLTQNEFLQQMLNDNKLKSKNFILNKQCSMEPINKLDLDFILNQITFDEIIQSLNANSTEWDLSFYIFNDLKSRIECLRQIDKLKVPQLNNEHESFILKNILYNNLSVINNNQELAHLKRMCKRYLEHHMVCLENKRLNIKLLWPVTHGYCSKAVFFNFNTNYELYQGIGWIANNVLKLNNGKLNRIGLGHIITKNNHYMETILNKQKFCMKYNSDSLIKNPYYGSKVLDLYKEYGANNLEEFKFIFIDALCNTRSCVYFLDNNLSYSIFLNNHFITHRAINSSNAEVLISLNQNDLINNSLEMLDQSINILNN